MKLKNSFFYTFKEDVKDEESISGNLLVRSGMIKKSSTGVYMIMPLGLRVIEKITNIVKEEMEQAGSQQLVMPSLILEDVYIKSGRRDNFGSDMFSLKDRFNRNYVLGPTHEELFVEAAKTHIKSYKDMPFNLYQIASKYRDEPRPRYGLIRVREFTMKDAYSFDVDEESADIAYQKQFNAYKNIFDKIGIDYKIVKADTGSMGGTLSEEFQAVTDIGEDTLVICPNCGYASNEEVSKFKIRTYEKIEKKSKKLIDTPNLKTINELSESLSITKENIVKTLIYKTKEQFYACLVSGDRDVNELKLSKLLKVKELSLATDEEIEQITSSEVGFAGPIGINATIIADEEVMNKTNFLIGSNQKDKHFINANVTDFSVDIIGNISNVIIGDLCVECEEKLIFKKGIEIGNTFKLGTKYSESLGLKYLDEFNNEKNVVMGCYGIGIGRIMASYIEQNNDEYGIIWNNKIAPYLVSIVVIDPRDLVQIEEANKLYDAFKKLNIDCILDDREKRPGIKFNDMDLIGIPYRITIGKKINEQLVELKLRTAKEIKEYKIDEIVSIITELTQ